MRIACLCVVATSLALGSPGCGGSQRAPTTGAAASEGEPSSRPVRLAPHRDDETELHALPAAHEDAEPVEPPPVEPPPE